MISLVVLALTFVNTPDPQEQAMQAMSRGEYRTTAKILDGLARDATDEDLAIAVLRASSAWELAFERQNDAHAVCDGLELLRWYFGRTDAPYHKLVDTYWSLVEQAREHAICSVGRKHVLLTPRELALPDTAKARQVDDSPREVPRPRVNAATVGKNEIQTESREQPHPNPKRMKLAGAVLTGLGGIGVGVLIGQGAEVSRRYNEYISQPMHDEHLYQQGKLLERWMIGTGVTTCAAIVTGVTLLAVARHRHVELRPSLGGISIRTQF